MAILRKIGDKVRVPTTVEFVIENKRLNEKLTYAKNIIQDLLDNSDEYARQRAIDFLKEEENEK